MSAGVYELNEQIKLYGVPSSQLWHHYPSHRHFFFQLRTFASFGHFYYIEHFQRHFRAYGSLAPVDLFLSDSEKNFELDANFFFILWY